MLTLKQKQELAIEYMKKRNISFGSAMADERAVEMFVDALTYREEMYQHTINEFKESHTKMLQATWEEMNKWMQRK